MKRGMQECHIEKEERDNAMFKLMNGWIYFWKLIERSVNMMSATFYYDWSSSIALSSQLK